MMKVDLCDDQKYAIEKLVKWYQSPRKARPFFVLNGYAGTGKTTTVSSAIDALGLAKDAVRFAAYTGKAAAVLREKGNEGASTVHRLIYLTQIYQREILDGHGTPQRDAKGDILKRTLYKIVVNPNSDLVHCRLAVLDECSMLSHQTWTDLLSFATPAAAIGDPGQLPPPTNSPSVFTDMVADHLLTDNHRQAAGNGIIAASIDARLGNRLKSSYGANVVSINRDTLLKLTAEVDFQFICGKNGIRKQINNLCKANYGFAGQPYPRSPGAKIVCRKNNHRVGVMNGELFVTDSDAFHENADSYRIWIKRPEDGSRFEVNMSKMFFVSDNHVAGLDWFDWGYCLTAHTAQGSEWENVVLIDDRLFADDPEFRKLWLYTAITRASENLFLYEGRI